MKPFSTFSFVFESTLFLFIITNAENNDPCKDNDHFTDPTYTCCASQRYASSSIYTTKSTECLGKITSDNIVHFTWSLYRCLLEEALGDGKEINFDTIQEVLAKDFPNSVKSDIKTYMEELKTSNYNPFEKMSVMEPFKDVAAAWDAYYAAENWACNIRAKNRTLTLWTWKNFTLTQPTCLGWIQQNFKRGDCCSRIPVPLEMFPDPYIGLDQYELKKFTVEKFMNLVGTYKIEDTALISRSYAVASCRRAALFLKLGILKEDDIKTWKSTPASRIIDDNIRSFIPRHLSSFTNSFLEMIKGSNEMQTDEDIRMLSNFSISGEEHFPFIEQWKNDGKFNLTETRMLLWNCRAVSMAVTLYKTLNLTEMCFPKLSETTTISDTET